MLIDLPPADQQLLTAKAHHYGMSEAELVAAAVASYSPVVFDRERIQASLDSGIVSIPKGLAKDKQAFREWLRQRNDS
ncbi:MAG: hypothetical protein Q4D05_05780 [Acinetobacter sp.]|nr:hypothetical protein [Acinetobacter sp.]